MVARTFPVLDTTTLLCASPTPHEYYLSLARETAYFFPMQMISGIQFTLQPHQLRDSIRPRCEDRQEESRKWESACCAPEKHSFEAQLKSGEHFFSCSPGLLQKCCTGTRLHCRAGRDYFRKLKCFCHWRSLRTG